MKADRQLSVAEIEEYWVGMACQEAGREDQTFSVVVNMLGLTRCHTPQSSITSQSRKEWFFQQIPHTKRSGHTAYSLCLAGGLFNTHTTFLRSRYMEGSSPNQPTTVPTQQ